MANRIGRPKAALYARIADGADADAVFADAQVAAKELASDLAQGVDARLARRIADMPELEHHRIMSPPTSPPPFDLAWQVVAPEGELSAGMTDAVAGMAKALSGRIDEVEVFAGSEVAITAGDGPVYIVMPLRRLAALDRAGFMTMWFDGHAQLGEEVEGVRYRQNHVDVDAATRLGTRVGSSAEPLDGLAESYFDTLDDAVAIMSQTSVTVDAIVDERRFIDHARSRFALYETQWRRPS